ncbi:hypothetical protein MML48_2g00015677 [Holotrichia oblita]|uniref:Uncharacterized protein n=1 Tax=Holotrichia oblita TaxID=644536 RepID=A0ACB9TMD3_HOLOL|nr:hypothetical protein MML48_2g00015677 [Holotrichia oblita]
MNNLKRKVITTLVLELIESDEEEEVVVLTIQKLIHDEKYKAKITPLSVPKYPSGIQDLTETVEHFQEWQWFPNVIGAIDGTHIPITAPAKYQTTYCNRHHYHSIILQAVCKADYTFTDMFAGLIGERELVEVKCLYKLHKENKNLGEAIAMDKQLCIEMINGQLRLKRSHNYYYQVITHADEGQHEAIAECCNSSICLGYPGSVHDARAVANSKTVGLCSKLPENAKYILGDSAYPCSQYLLTPYKDNGYLTANQKKLINRQLYHLKTRSISILFHQIKACCVLHNLASEDELQYFEEREITSDEEAEDENEVDNTLNDSKNTGKLLRDLISSTL